MPNCQTCGVAMGASERTRNRQNVAGNWHVDCEYMEHVRDVGAAVDPSWKAEVIKSVTKLVNKHSGVATNYP